MTDEIGGVKVEVAEASGVGLFIDQMAVQHIPCFVLVRLIMVV